MKNLPAFVIFLALVGQGLQAFQQASVKASVPPHDKTYPFMVFQYELFKKDILGKNSYLYLDYDTDALYLQPALKFGRLTAGLQGKGHAADWQNLNYFTDNTTGSRIKSLEIKAAYLMGGGFLTYQFFKRYFINGYGQYKKAFLADRNDSGLVLNDGSWFEGGVRTGWYQKYTAKPLIDLGSSFTIMGASHTAIQEYTYQAAANTNISVPDKQFFEAGINYFRGQKFFSHFYQLSLSVGAFDFARSGQATDLLFAYSTGGPEARYRRLAGFAFSEFRTPAYFLTNLDFFWNLSGPVYLWTVIDALALDRKEAGSRFHSGAGLGVYLDLAETISFLKGAALYARVDFGFSAKRAENIEKLQVFTGLSATW